MGAHDYPVKDDQFIPALMVLLMLALLGIPLLTYACLPLKTTQGAARAMGR